MCDLVGGTDTAVHGDAQSYTAVSQPIDRINVEPVAIFKPVRDKGLHPRAQRTQRGCHQNRRSHPIDIKVAIDSDGFLTVYGLRNALYSGAHTCELQRVAERTIGGKK